jgi:hypothetical protein
MVKKFKDRYVLGEGYPELYYFSVSLSKDNIYTGINSCKALKRYREFQGKAKPFMYRLILERIKPHKKKK